MGGMRSCCTRQQQNNSGGGDPGNEETRANSLYSSSRIPCVLQRFCTRWTTGRSVGG